MSAAFRVAFNEMQDIIQRQQIAMKISDGSSEDFLNAYRSLSRFELSLLPFGAISPEFADFLAEDWSSGRGPARIKAAFNAEVSILAGGLEFYAGGLTAGATGGTLLAFGAANVSEGVSSYMNIFDNGTRDYNAIRVGLQSVYGEQNGANIFYGIDLGLGSAGLFNFTNNGVSIYTTSGVTFARDAFLMNATVESIDTD